MDDQQWLAERFEQHRGRLQAVAYRMFGSLTEADILMDPERLRQLDLSALDDRR